MSLLFVNDQARRFANRCLLSAPIAIKPSLCEGITFAVQNKRKISLGSHSLRCAVAKNFSVRCQD